MVSFFLMAERWSYEGPQAAVALIDAVHGAVSFCFCHGCTEELRQSSAFPASGTFSKTFWTWNFCAGQLFLLSAF